MIKAAMSIFPLRAAFHSARSAAPGGGTNNPGKKARGKGTFARARKISPGFERALESPGNYPLKETARISHKAPKRIKN